MDFLGIRICRVPRRTDPIFANGWQRVPVEVNGHTYHVRSMSQAEVESYFHLGSDPKNNRWVPINWVVAQCCDEFSGYDAVDIAKNVSPKVLAQLADAITEESGLVRSHSNAQAEEGADPKKP